MSEHREKAVEAMARRRWNHSATRGLDWKRADETQRAFAREQAAADIEAAGPHLQRMYWERFREAVRESLLGDDASIRIKQPPSDAADVYADGYRDALGEFQKHLEAAIDKAQELMEESK